MAFSAPPIHGKLPAMPARLARLCAAGGALLGIVVFGTALGVALTVISPGLAAACTRPGAPEFTLDPEATGVDRQPPSRPGPITASARRHNGYFCESSGLCISSSCGSEGSLELQLTPASDDRAAPGELGYRLRWVEGSLPAALEEPLGRIARGTEQLRFELPFDPVPELDATFQLIAIDRAGNESEASEPFHAAFDGCTRSVGFGGCAEDMGGRVSCADGACFEVAEAGCALAPGRSARTALAGLLPVLAAIALARRQRASRAR